MVTRRTGLFLAIVSLWLATCYSLPRKRSRRDTEPADDECDQGHDELLCASDDVTYLNLCEFQKAVAKNPRLKIIENGACVCDPKEQHEWDPLCASNGESYANNCELQKARKFKALHIRHLGLCNALLKRNVITLREVQKLKMWHSFMPKDLYETLSSRDVVNSGTSDYVSNVGPKNRDDVGGDSSNRNVADDGSTKLPKKPNKKKLTKALLGFNKSRHNFLLSTGTYGKWKSVD